MRLSRDFSAFSYWTVPRIALSTSTAKMTMVLSTLPEKAEITAAIMSMSTMRSLNCSRKTWSVLFFFPSESLVGAVLLRPAAGLLGGQPLLRRRSAPPGPAAVSFCNRPVSYHSFLSQCSPAERRQKKTFPPTAACHSSCRKVLLPHWAHAARPETRTVVLTAYLQTTPFSTAVIIA